MLVADAAHYNLKDYRAAGGTSFRYPVSFVVPKWGRIGDES